GPTAERGIPVFDGSAVLEVREVRYLRRGVSEDLLDALEGFALLADIPTWPDLHDMRHLFLTMQVHTARAEDGVAGKAAVERSNNHLAAAAKQVAHELRVHIRQTRSIGDR